jgi:hypothetical protein
MFQLMTTVTKKSPVTLEDVPGWFGALDQSLFRWILQWQAATGPRGDLLELGSYLGKSAILLGDHLGREERFTVCDVFDSTVPDQAKSDEVQCHPSPIRDTFESNYLAFHSRLPVIVEGPTRVIADHVAAESCRFVHVDASHLYEQVHEDIAVTGMLLREDGVVVCEDYRSADTPGVAAAVWDAVMAKGLNPICVSAAKFYGTWGDPVPLQQAMLSWLPSRPDDWHHTQEIGPHRIIVIGTAEPAAAPAHHRFLKDLLPPVLTRALKRARHLLR